MAKIAIPEMYPTIDEFFKELLIFILRFPA